MITRFRVQNYKALRDVDLALTPIHVLIGPNDTGKTSILEAIQTLSRTVDHPLTQAFFGRESGALLWMGGGGAYEGEVSFHVEFSDSIRYLLTCVLKTQDRGIVGLSEEIHVHTGFLWKADAKRYSETHVWRLIHRGESPSELVAEALLAIRDRLRPLQSYRWVPQLLALPAAPHAREQFSMHNSGFGLPLCLDDIIGEERNRFAILESRFLEIFPEIEQIKLRPESGFAGRFEAGTQLPLLSQEFGKGLYFKLRSSSYVIPASCVSDGILLVLAYLAVLKSPQPPRVLLVEEPENGIHPKRLREVLQILRELVGEQQHTQVILTTHSPYVVDLFEPDEVTLCTKGSDGAVQVRRLSESALVQRLAKVFTLGEIWTGEGDEALAVDQPAEEPAS